MPLLEARPPRRGAGSQLEVAAEAESGEETRRVEVRQHGALFEPELPAVEGARTLGLLPGDRDRDVLEAHYSPSAAYTSL